MADATCTVLLTKLLTLTLKYGKTMRRSQSLEALSLKNKRMQSQCCKLLSRHSTQM